MIFKTFKATIIGSWHIEDKVPKPTHREVSFSKRRIPLNPSQVERIYLDPMFVQLIADKAEYTFDKLINKEDKRKFSIIITQKLNALDDGIHYLDLSTWNKIKANIIHGRYWLYREREWFVKTLIATIIGAAFGIIGAFLGYKAGFQNGTKTTTPQLQVTPQQVKR